MRKTEYNVLCKGNLTKCMRKTEHNVLCKGNLTKCMRKTEHNSKWFRLTAPIHIFKPDAVLDYIFSPFNYLWRNP